MSKNEETTEKSLMELSEKRVYPIDRLIAHQGFALGPQMLTTFTKEKGFDMVWTPDGVRMKNGENVVTIPLANIVVAYEKFSPVESKIKR